MTMDMNDECKDIELNAYIDIELYNGDINQLFDDYCEEHNVDESANNYDNEKSGILFKSFIQRRISLPHS
jgi:hypothetical protein